MTVMPAMPVTDDTLEAWSLFLTAPIVIRNKVEGALDAKMRLSMPEYHTLSALAAAPDRQLRMGNLANVLFVSRSGMTRLVDRLEKRKLIQRKSDDCDERSIFAALTAKGLASFNDAQFVYLNAVMLHFLSVLDADERAVLTVAFRRLCGADVLTTFCTTPNPTQGTNHGPSTR